MRERSEESDPKNIGGADRNLKPNRCDDEREENEHSNAVKNVREKEAVRQNRVSGGLGRVNVDRNKGGRRQQDSSCRQNPLRAIVFPDSAESRKELKPVQSGIATTDRPDHRLRAVLA